MRKTRQPMSVPRMMTVMPYATYFSRLWSTVFLLLALWPVVTLADESRQELDVVVVTASRIGSSTAETSESVEVLAHDEIIRRNPVSVADILRHVAGINVIQQGARGNVTSILMRGGEPNFTVVLIDGVKVNDPTNTRGGSYDFSYLDPSIIEKVEIVRGPMSALYGSDSLAGVVNIITRPGSSGSVLKAEVGGHGLVSGSLQVGAGGDRADGYFRVHALSEDGDIEGASYEDAGFDGAFKWTTERGLEWGIGTRYMEADSSGFPEDSGGPDLAVLREVDTRSVEEFLVHGYMEHAISDATGTSIRLRHYARDEQFDSPGIAAGVFDGVPPNSADTEFSRKAIEWNLEHSLSDSKKFVFGSEWQQEDGHSLGEIDFGFPIPTSFTLQRDTLSFYGEFSLRLSKALIQASLRWDDPEDVEAETSAKLGFVYDLTDDTQLRANFSQGFKAPSFFALAHPLVGNPDLLSETATSFDIGMRHTARWGDIELSIFHTDYENLIDFDPELFSNVNRSEVASQGAELSVTFRPASNLSLSGHATFLDTDIVASDSRLRGRPDWRLGAVLDWSIDVHWQLVASFLALDEFWESSIPTGGMYLSGYERFDLALNYQMHDRIRFAVTFDNLLDESYEEAIGFPAARRRVRVGAIVQF